MNHPSPLFIWLDDHPKCYLWFVGVALAGGLILALRAWFRPATEPGPHTDWAWGLVLLAILAAGRWPSMLIPAQLNPDESQFIAGAHTLTQDPVFWRSVDGTTSGPLNFFVLWPAGWLAGWNSFLGARLTALFLLAAAFMLFHQTLVIACRTTAVRLATLAAVTGLALTNSVDLLHYSSELVSVTWMGVAAYAAARRWVMAGGPGWCALGGLALGAIPMSKLQPVPIALVAGLGWVVAEIIHRQPGSERHLVYLLAGAILPSALFVGQVLLAGEWSNFTTSYILTNLQYTAGQGSVGHLNETWLAKSQEEDSLLHLWLPAMMMWCVLALRPVRDRATHFVAVAAVLGLGVSVFCVLSPGRPFLHYWQLALPGLTCLLGALLASVRTRPARFERWLMAACAVALVGGLWSHRLAQRSFFMGAFSYFETHPPHPVAVRVLAHARSGEAMAVWGWATHLYVGTGLRQATRNADCDRLLSPGKLQEYFRDRYLADVMVNRPEIFVDAVGPESVYFRSPELKHYRNFPELGAVIRRDYVLVEKTEGVEIYRRRDLVAPAPTPR